MWLQQEQLGQVGSEGEGWKAGALSVQRHRTGSRSVVQHQLELKMQNPDKELPSSPPQVDFLRVKQQERGEGSFANKMPCTRPVTQHTHRTQRPISIMVVDKLAGVSARAEGGKKNVLEPPPPRTPVPKAQTSGGRHG